MEKTRIKRKSQKLFYENGYIRIQCKNGFILIDEQDLNVYLNQSWRINTNGYVSTCHGKFMSMHRKIMKAKSNQMIDHANGVKSDNRRCNLRFCNRSENLCNVKSRTGNSSKYKGVSRLSRRTKEKYWAYIDKDKKRFSLGVFNTEIEAAKQYNKFALQYHGEFARLNVIEEEL